MLMRTPPRWVRPKRLRPPGFIVPCQPVLAPKVPEGDGWLHELKHDGSHHRINGGPVVEPQRPELVRRDGRDRRGHHGPPVTRIVLDGEAAATPP